MTVEDMFYEMGYEVFFHENEDFKMIRYQKEESLDKYRIIKFLITKKEIQLYCECIGLADIYPLQLTEKEIEAVIEQYKRIKQFEKIKRG